jgi:hypothetical protein
MTPEVMWLLGILVTILLGGATLTVMVLLSVLNRKNDTIAKLTEANLNYRFALLQLGPAGEAVSKLVQSLPLSPTDGAGK